MKKLLLPTIALLSAPGALAQDAAPAALPDDLPPGLVIEDGAAQPASAFSGRRNRIQEALWVETEFDSDGDGKPWTACTSTSPARRSDRDRRAQGRR